LTCRSPCTRLTAGRDFDNAIASLKASLDGLADALRVDDNRFRLSFAWGEPCKPGRVEIVIGEKA
jgi:hypothetical protein